MEGNTKSKFQEEKLHISKTNLNYLELKPGNQALEWKTKEWHLEEL